MKIHAGNIFVLNQQKTSALYNKVASKQGFTKTAELSELFDADSPAVKLAISEEGLANYRNSLFDDGEKDKNVPGNKKEGLLSWENMARSYNFALGNRFTFIGNDQTMEEKASDLFHAYAELYDEIVRGYESGQREIYDPNTPDGEGGYRKLTMEEELDALNAAYKGYADALERIAGRRRRKEDVAILEGIAATRARLFGAQDGRTLEAKEAVLRLKNEAVPENLNGQLVKAAAEFAQQYALQKNAAVEDLLKGITLFS